MTLAAYLRISTASQSEASQRQEIERWLVGNGIDPNDVLWFVDVETGDHLDRPEFKKLQAAVFAGEVDTIVVYKLDRISRSLKDGIATLCDWLEWDIRVVATSQQFDFAGAVGQLIGAVLFAVAQMEQQTRRERQQAGIDVAPKRGKYQGRQNGSTKAMPTRARELRENGNTLEEIAAAMKVSRRTIQRYLRAS